MKYPSDMSESLRLRTFFVYRGVRDALRGTSLNPSTYTGSITDRISGLETLLEQCSGSSILDIGSADGLVAYEFARRGAALVHGIDSNTSDVLFSQRLFRSVETEGVFLRRNLSSDFEILLGQGRGPLCPTYDIVLFLGIYQHLKLQMPKDRLLLLLGMVLDRSSMFFAIRAPVVSECDEEIRKRGFLLVHSCTENPKVGELRVYQREE